MPKKKLKRKEPQQYDIMPSSPPPTQRPGRAPKIPGNLLACFDDLNGHTEAWIRRFNDVWFIAIPPGLERPEGVPTFEGVAEQYDEAIDTLERLAGKVKDGLLKLKKGRAAAKKRWADEKKTRQKVSAKKSPRQPPGETDYFGLESGEL